MFDKIMNILNIAREDCTGSIENNVKDVHNTNSSYLLAFSKSCMHWTRASTASTGQAL